MFQFGVILAQIKISLVSSWPKLKIVILSGAKDLLFAGRNRTHDSLFHNAYAFADSSSD